MSKQPQDQRRRGSSGQNRKSQRWEKKKTPPKEEAVTKLECPSQGKDKNNKNKVDSKEKAQAPPLTYINAAATMLVPVPENDLNTIRRLEERGINVKLGQKEFMFNQHEYLSAIRYKMTIRALWALFQQGCRNILSVYGSDRDLKINDVICKRTKIGEKLKVSVWSPKVEPQDLIRGKDPRVLIDRPDFHQFDGFMFVHVYGSSSVGENFQFSPQYVANFAKIGKVVWVGHHFPGAMGTVGLQGAWVRNFQDKIIFKPDDATRPYGPHSDCSWIFEDSGAQTNPGICWCEVAQLDGTYVYLFDAVTLPFTPPHPAIQKAYILDTTISFKNQIMCWILKFLPDKIQNRCFTDTSRRFINIPGFHTRQRLVDVNLAVQLSNHMASRTYTTYVLKSLAARANNLIMEDPSYKILVKRFPEAVADIVRDTVEYVFCTKVNIFAQNLEDVRDIFSSYFSRYNTAINQIDVPTETRRVWPYILGCGALMLGAYYTKKAILSGTLIDVCRNLLPYARGAWELIKPTLLGVCTNQFLLECGFSPLLEESLKHKFRYGTPAILGLETLFHYKTGNLIHYIPTAIMHICTAKMNLPMAVSCHIGWNCLASFSKRCSGSIFRLGSMILSGSFLTLMLHPKLHQNAWRDFKKEFYEQPWASRSIITHDVPKGVTPFSSDDAWVTKEPEPCFEKKPQDFRFKLRGTLGFSFREVSSERVLNILPTCFPFYYVGRTRQMAQGMLEARILAKPLLEPEDQEDNWEIVKLPPIEQKPQIIWQDLVMQWLDDIEEGPKRMKLRRAYTIVTQNHFDFWAKPLNHTQLMVKTNEALMKIDDQGYPQCKPRSIAIVDPIVQVLVGPQIDEATNRLGEQWNWDFHEYPIIKNGRVLHITYGGKSTDLKLTFWMQQALMMPVGESAVIVSGDDSLFVSNTKTGLVFIEADAKSFDQSQSFGPLAAERTLLSQLGVGDDALRKLKMVSWADYHIGELTIDRFHRPMRDTGGPDTAVGNALVMGTSWFFVWSEIDDDGYHVDRVVKLFAFLGFEMKLKILRDPTEVTFLKGMWYPAQPRQSVDLVWSVLPSRILKMGKSHNDPRKIYCENDLGIAAQKFLGDLARTYACFARIPIISTFIDRFSIPLPNPKFHLEPWKVQHEGDTFSIDRVGALQVINQRYDLTTLEVIEMEYLINQSQIFNFLSHPGFVKLACVDYAN